MQAIYDSRDWRFFFFMFLQQLVEMGTRLQPQLAADLTPHYLGGI